LDAAVLCAHGILLILDASEELKSRNQANHGGETAACSVPHVEGCANGTPLLRYALEKMAFINVREQGEAVF